MKAYLSHLKSIQAKCLVLGGLVLWGGVLEAADSYTPQMNACIDRVLEKFESLPGQAYGTWEEKFWSMAKPGKANRWYKRHKNQLKAYLVGHGGEGRVFHHPEMGRKAVKVWKPGARFKMKHAVNALMAYRELISSDPVLSRLMRVAEVFEQGENYVVREYAPLSVPLRDVINDPVIRAKRDAALERVQDLKFWESRPFMHKLKQALIGKPSENLHWDPETNRIFLFDPPLS